VDISSEDIPTDKEFTRTRKSWRLDMAESELLRKKAIELTIMSDKFHYGYQWEWCGVPIIRHPDDIVLQQEIIWSMKPSHVIETGIARGGSLVLSSSLLQICVGGGKVLGLDLKILAHTVQKLKPWVESEQIYIYECDSASTVAVNHVSDFLIDNEGPVLVVLDSNHTHDHVFNELNSFAPLIPVGSVVIVADTIIEEMPTDYYTNRPWSVGNNPLTALNRFLDLNSNFQIDERWSRRSLMGEFRDGIITKTSNSSASKAL
jgi:cephalosporin hydroxylase